MDKKCVICGKTFQCELPFAMYCSRRCKTKAEDNRNRVDMVCEICGKHFMGRPDRGARYCSKSCAAKATVPVKTLVCVDCGREFEFVGRTIKKRCPECWHKNRSRQAMSYRAAKDPTVVVGAGSGGRQRPEGSVTDPGREAVNRKRRERYAKDVADGRYSATYKYRGILTGHDKCEICGYDRYQSAIVVHHKDMDRTNNDRSNLAVLCANCHAAAHAVIRRAIKAKLEVPNLWAYVVSSLQNDESK